MEHRFANGWQAAQADNWCGTCLCRDKLPGLSTCEECHAKNLVRSRNRNDKRPTTRKTRKVMQDVLGGLAWEPSKER